MRETLWQEELGAVLKYMSKALAALRLLYGLKRPSLLTFSDFHASSCAKVTSGFSKSFSSINCALALRANSQGIVDLLKTFWLIGCHKGGVRGAVNVIKLFRHWRVAGRRLGRGHPPPGWCSSRAGPGCLAGLIVAAPLISNAMPDNSPATPRLSIPSETSAMSPFGCSGGL